MFDDATATSGVGAASLDLTGFGTAFVDVDLDADLDLVVVNGRVVRRRPHPRSMLDGHWRPYAEPNQLFINDGHGGFTDAGNLDDHIEVSRGLAAGDVDDDGDLDLVVTNGNGTVRLYRNDLDRAGHWLLIRAVDPALQRDAYGAVIAVEAGGRRQARLVTSAGSYLSSHDPRAHFGLGAADRVDAITVTWPDGATERFPGGDADRVVTLHRGDGETVAPDA
jgi:hypothetical protein